MQPLTPPTTGRVCLHAAGTIFAWLVESEAWAHSQPRPGHFNFTCHQRASPTPGGVLMAFKPCATCHVPREAEPVSNRSGAAPWPCRPTPCAGVKLQIRNELCSDALTSRRRRPTAADTVRHEPARGRTCPAASGRHGTGRREAIVSKSRTQALCQLVPPGGSDHPVCAAGIFVSSRDHPSSRFPPLNN